MKMILLLALIALSSAGLAKDIGQMGKLYPVIETDLIEHLKGRMSEKVESGEFEEAMSDFTERTKQYAKRPTPVGLPNAGEDRVFYYDPTFVVESDVINHDGRVLVKAGTTYDPLDVTPMTRNLCFINADVERQLAWAKGNCTNPSEHKVILTGGDLEEAQSALDMPIYFDQQGKLVKKLGLMAVPAYIKQEGNKLYVAEIAL